MSKTGSSKKTIIMTVLIIVLISATAYYMSSNAQDSGMAAEGDSVSSDSSGKYSKSLKNLNKILNSFQSPLFSNTHYLSLKSFVSLPLEIGLTGKANPFELPTPPEELLLELINQ